MTDDALNSKKDPVDSASLSSAAIDRGYKKFNEGDFQGAIGCFDEAIRYDPRNARAFFGRGFTHHHLHDLDLALRDYEEVIRLDPSDPLAYLNRGTLLLHRGDQAAAIADYNEAVRLAPRNIHARHYRAMARIRQEEFDQAIADLDEVIRQVPRNPEVFYSRALARRGLGRIEEALDDLSRAIELNPKNQAALRTRAELLQETGDLMGAQADIERAREAEADDEGAETGGQQPRSIMNKISSISKLLQSHFDPKGMDALTVTTRKFPFRVRADLQRAMERLFSEKVEVLHFGGVLHRYSQEGLDLSNLMAPNPHDPPFAVPPEYDEVDIGEDEPVRCLKNGLWLLQDGTDRFAILLGQAARFDMIGGLQIQVATVNDPEGARFSRDFFHRLEEAVLASGSYRGKILSLEFRDHYTGMSSGIMVHRLKTVGRDEVILPARTLELLDRNILGFVRQRPALAKLGLPTKKGLLFYGPPGTGKTHTLHYLAGTLPGHTTFLITAEQMGLLNDYMTLARLLQPSVVVIEDVDLIARDRSAGDSSCSQVLLHQLLNEMDGLRPDAEVLFILTTNRPGSLETALASRPGRIDQAIEFPLPDEEGRAKLIRLYSRGMTIYEEVIRSVVKRTEKVSAAFIKELMRRSAQFHLERESSSQVSFEDIEKALEELLFAGGSLNRKLLGAAVEETADAD